MWPARRLPGPHYFALGHKMLLKPIGLSSRTHPTHKGPFHASRMPPQLPGEIEKYSLQSCIWEGFALGSLPGEGPEEGQMIRGVCSSPFSPIWVSFRSHGRLQHGGRPQGACCQHPPGLPSSCWHLVSSPGGNQLERGRENPRQKRGLLL